MKLMTGREYLSKIRRKASASPWHTRVTRSAELFIRVPAKPVITLGRLVFWKAEKFQENQTTDTQIKQIHRKSALNLCNLWLKKLFWVNDLPRDGGGGDYVGRGEVEFAGATAAGKVSILRTHRDCFRRGRGTRSGVYTC